MKYTGEMVRVSKPQKPMNDGKILVYGLAEDGLVFLTLTRPHDLAQMYEARRTAKTWGDFRRRISPRMFKEIANFDRDPIPDSDSLADHDPVSDYWPFPNSEQLDILPDDGTAVLT